MQPFNLEKNIQHWRSSLAQNKKYKSEDLDELENHLRDSIEELKKEDCPEQKAFTLAVEKIGDLDMMEKEFSKVSRPGSLIQWKITSDTTDARLGMYSCFVVSFLILLLATRKLTSMDLTPFELMTGALLTLILAMFFAFMGISLDSKRKAASVL